jgi:hypothetical protein
MPRFAVRVLAVFASSIVLVGAVAGCAGSRTFVLEPVSQSVDVGSIRLERLDAVVNTDAGAADDFEKKLAGQLTEQTGATIAGAGQHADLVVKHRFVLFDQGAGAARVGSGIAGVIGSPFYGIGDGSIGVEVIYTLPDGKNVGHIVSDGPITGAFGTTGGALESAAAAVAKYTKANFTCPTCGEVGKPAASPSAVKGLTQSARSTGTTDRR